MEWHEVFKGVESDDAVALVEEEEVERAGLLRRLRNNLGKARHNLRDHLRLIVFRGIGDELWEQVEEALLAADVGVEATGRIIEELERRAATRKLTSSEDLVDEVAAVMADMLRPEDPEEQLIDVSEKPSVLLITGVNGTGKTTTIGKLAYRLKQVGKTPLVVAADTFRAPPPSSSPSGPTASAATSCAKRPAVTRQRSSTTAWTPPAHAAPTWSSSTRPAASTLRSTS